jgi:hypothetical protein
MPFLVFQTPRIAAQRKNQRSGFIFPLYNKECLLTSTPFAQLPGRQRGRAVSYLTPPAQIPLRARVYSQIGEALPLGTVGYDTGLGRSVQRTG